MVISCNSQDFCYRHVTVICSFPSFSSPAHRTCVFSFTQELYEKSLVRLEDGSLPADLLQIKTFLTVPQVTTVQHTQLLRFSQTDALMMTSYWFHIFVFQNLVKVMTMCPQHDLVSLAVVVVVFVGNVALGLKKCAFGGKIFWDICFLVNREPEGWRFCSWASISLTLKQNTTFSSKFF